MAIKYSNQYFDEYQAGYQERLGALKYSNERLQQNLANECQLIQDDLACILDGFDEKILDNACQVVVDRFKILLESLKQPE